MSPRTKYRRLAVVTAFVSALLIGNCDLASGASSDFLDGRPDEFRLTCVATAGQSCATIRFWVVLSDGYSDTVTVNVGSDSFGGYPRWSLRMPENRYLRWHDKPSGYAICEQTDYNSLFAPYYAPARTLLCSRDTEVNIRLGDLNDTFVASLEAPTVFNIFRRGRRRLHPHREGERHAQGRQRERRPSQRPCRRQPVRRGRQRHPGRRRRRRRPGLRRRERHRPVSGPHSALNVTLDGTANDGASGENDKVGASCENVEAWNGADKVVGSTSANKLYGNDGNDTLKGGGGNDRLYGGNGKDSALRRGRQRPAERGCRRRHDRRRQRHGHDLRRRRQRHDQRQGRPEGHDLLRSRRLRRGRLRRRCWTRSTSGPASAADPERELS